MKFTALPRSLQPEKKFFIRRAKRLLKYALQLPQIGPYPFMQPRRFPSPADWDTHRAMDAAGKIYS